MSHFVVGVICPDESMVEELLAPYSETDETYYEFEVVFPTITEAEAAFEEWRKEDHHKCYNYADVFEWLDQWHGYGEQDGAFGYTHNPNAKWDWYDDQGGRWTGAFDENLKPDVERNEFGHAYRVKDYDYGMNQQKYDQAIKFWHEYVLGENPEAHKDCMWKPEYYTMQYGTMENYATHSAMDCLPYAFLTPDGEWHEPGTMGWFACDDATPEGHERQMSEWLQAVKNPDWQDYHLVWVDCHI